jgi:hypothetical protein
MSPAAAAKRRPKRPATSQKNMFEIGSTIKRTKPTKYEIGPPIETILQPFGPPPTPETVAKLSGLSADAFHLYRLLYPRPRLRDEILKVMPHYAQKSQGELRVVLRKIGRGWDVDCLNLTRDGKGGHVIGIAPKTGQNLFTFAREIADVLMPRVRVEDKNES